VHATLPDQPTSCGTAIFRQSNAMSPELPIDDVELAQICQRHHIRKLSLFGSRAKGTARADSDIDLLVEFEAEARPSYLDLAEIESELSLRLGGVAIDLRTAGELSPYFRDEVLSQARVQYVAR
jgi:hypothetical protein